MDYCSRTTMTRNSVQNLKQLVNSSENICLHSSKPPVQKEDNPIIPKQIHISSTARRNRWGLRTLNAALVRVWRGISLKSTDRGRRQRLRPRRSPAGVYTRSSMQLEDALRGAAGLGVRKTTRQEDLSGRRDRFVRDGKQVSGAQAEGCSHVQDLPVRRHDL